MNKENQHRPPAADEAAQKPQPPRYYDIEEYRRAGNRKLWGVIALLGVTTLLSFTLALVAMLKPTPVIAFDSKGRPMVFDETYRPNIETTKIRVEHFTQIFLSKYIGINSARLNEDLAEALNLTVPLLRETIIKDGSQAERRAKYEDANVVSRLVDLQFRISDFDPADTNSEIYLYTWGKHLYEPLSGHVEEEIARHVFAKLILVRQPVSRSNPYGLLVRYIEYYVFESSDELEAEILKLMAG